MAYRTDGFGLGGFSLTPVVKKLVIANVAVFLITWVIPSRFVLEWLAFRPDHLLTRPWGAVTYMFVHADFMHLFFMTPILGCKDHFNRFFTDFFENRVGTFLHQP